MHDQIAQGSGDRERQARLMDDLAALNSSADLEREEGIAAGRAGDLVDQGRGDRRLDLARQQRVDRVAGERTSDQPARRATGRGFVQQARRGIALSVRAYRSDHADAFRFESTKHEGQDVSGRRVEPGVVVERDQNRALRGKRPQQAERGHRDRQRLRERTLWFLKKHRHTQGGGLRRRQLRKSRVQDAAKQVAQGGECQQCLGFGGATDQDVVIPLPRGLDRGTPQRRLAGPNLALDDKE
ncbi:MAG TPA: hypothetical protein VFO05_03440 [Candidatus Limnocylindrales bacterium]|nr:hypothetical protein [Candidatus Limnocylindrales bacterium]